MCCPPVLPNDASLVSPPASRDSGGFSLRRCDNEARTVRVYKSNPPLLDEPEVVMPIWRGKRSNGKTRPSSIEEKRVAEVRERPVQSVFNSP